MVLALGSADTEGEMALSNDELLMLGLVYPRDALICDLSTPCDLSPVRAGKGGYATVRHSGSSKLLHRVVYAKHRGISLKDIDGILVRHLCNNSICRNPLHLAAGSYHDNWTDAKLADRTKLGSFKGGVHGERKPNAILTEEQVRAARAEFVPWNKEHGATALARRYGVTLSAMHDALSGRKWRHVA